MTTTKTRGERALELLKELLRVRSLGFAECLDTIECDCDECRQWRAAWKSARELLAEETPATEPTEAP